MNGYLSNILDKAKMTFSQASAQAKERIFAITGTPSATIEQLVGYIQNHPETTLNNKELLGNVYTFYELSEGGIHYYLETKGSFILQLDVYTKGHNIVSYRSYRDQYSLNNPIKFPGFQQ